MVKTPQSCWGHSGAFATEVDGRWQMADGRWWLVGWSLPSAICHPSPPTGLDLARSVPSRAMPLEITRRDGRREALSGLIDYAGLFPPASLAMDEAIAEYRRARTGPHAWLVERFICPAGQLLELAGLLSATMTEDEEPWSLVVIARPTDAGLITDFEAEMSGGADVSVVETMFPEGGDAAAVVALLEVFGAVVFFEVRWQSGVAASLDVLAAVRESLGRALGAKVRCGGLMPEAFPPPEALAGFLVPCRDPRGPGEGNPRPHPP